MSKHYYPWTPPQAVKTDDPAGRILETLVRVLVKEQKKNEKKKDEKKPDDKKKSDSIFTKIEFWCALILLGMPIGTMELLFFRNIGKVMQSAFN